MDSFIELFAVSPLVLVVLFFVAILAGFIDSLAGGGGRPAAGRYRRPSILSAARWLIWPIRS